MEKMQILQSDLLEIIFDGRNKNYGAYDLRKSYPKRMEWALAGTAMLCLIFLIGNVLANKGKRHADMPAATEVFLSDFKEKEQPLIEPKKSEPRKMATEQYNAPVIAPDQEVTAENELKPMDALEDVKIGNQHIEGEKYDGVTEVPVESSLGGPGIQADEPDYDREFKTVQIQARFPDGLEGWIKFLQKNLNSDLPVQNGAPAGMYTVMVSFIVDKSGNISEVQAENDPGFGTREEAIRTIKKGPRWIPAEQNGRAVIYRQKQSISFKVAEE